MVIIKSMDNFRPVQKLRFLFLVRYLLFSVLKAEERKLKRTKFVFHRPIGISFLMNSFTKWPSTKLFITLRAGKSFTLLLLLLHVIYYFIQPVNFVILYSIKNLRLQWFNRPVNKNVMKCWFLYFLIIGKILSLHLKY